MSVFPKHAHPFCWLPHALLLQAHTLVSFAQVLGPDDVESDYNEQETVSANPALWQHVFAADRVERPERRMN